MSTRNHIVIADPSTIIREGVMAMLAKLDGGKIDIAEIDDIENIAERLTILKPDILIINPIYLGIFSLNQIKNEADVPNLKTIALIAQNTPQLLFKKFDVAININDTIGTIKSVITTLLSEKSTPKQELSTREKEIVVQVVKGLTGKQIADKLCLSTHTIMTHRRNIASKLRIHSSAGLTIYAIVNKLVDINDVKDTINQQEKE